MAKTQTEIKARSHQTQWAAQFAVGSELCKKGYEVAFTSGHTTPIADLMVVSPESKRMFLVDVKGLHRENPWLLKRKAARKDLFYVLAYAPQGKANEFFIMTQQQATKLILDNLKRRGLNEEYRGFTGIGWKMASAHKDKWKVLPQ
jgi:hypothetical protein